MGSDLSFGLFLAGKRKEYHLTQEELAEKLFVSKSAIAKWETDRGIPDRQNLKEIAAFFNTSLDWLYKIIDRNEKETVSANDPNITGDIISVLEKHGYVVTRGKQEGEESK